jgi:hypothetical protein
MLSIHIYIYIYKYIWVYSICIHMHCVLGSLYMSTFYFYYICIENMIFSQIVFIYMNISIFTHIYIHIYMYQLLHTCTAFRTGILNMDSSAIRSHKITKPLEIHEFI